MDAKRNFYNKFLSLLSKEERNLIDQAMLFFTFDGIYATLPSSKIANSIKQKANNFEGLYIQ